MMWLFRAGQLERLNAAHSMAPVLADLVATGRRTQAGILLAWADEVMQADAPAVEPAEEAAPSSQAEATEDCENAEPDEPRQEGAEE